MSIRTKDEIQYDIEDCEYRLAEIMDEQADLMEEEIQIRNTLYALEKELDNIID